MSKSNLFQENRGQAQAVGVAWVRAPGQRGLWRIACSGCGREDRKRWAADMPTEIITKKLRGVGWTVDAKSPPLCPGCARAPKNNTNGKDTEPMPATTQKQDPRTDKLRLNGAYPMDAEQPETGQPTSGRRPRQYKRVAFAIIEETMAQLGLETRTELARMLGVADNTVSGWAKKGEVPAWVELACHGLRSLGQPAPEPRQAPDDIVIVPACAPTRRTRWCRCSTPWRWTTGRSEGGSNDEYSPLPRSPLPDPLRRCQLLPSPRNTSASRTRVLSTPLAP